MTSFGWNLPPGCRVSDIPGNRPQDEQWERLSQRFLEDYWNPDELWEWLGERYGVKLGAAPQTAMDAIRDAVLEAWCESEIDREERGEPE